MKKYYILLFTLISFNLISQVENNVFNYKGKEISLSQNVTEHYSEEFVLNLKQKDIELLLYLNYFSINAFKVVSVGDKLPFLDLKLKDFQKYEKSLAKDFKPDDINSFNLLAYEIRIKDKSQFINVGNSEFAIKIISKKEFIESFNDYKSNLSIK